MHNWGFYLVMTAELTEGQVILPGWEREEYGSEYQAGTQGGLVNSQSEQEIYPPLGPAMFDIAWYPGVSLLNKGGRTEGGVGEPDIVSSLLIKRAAYRRWCRRGLRRT